ncbi:hypothetical protein J421_5872 (plasmid) [Gemmatirosa kalamazoonensis]|uniref:DUF4440 domain-containing protein n=1 Tax=Gemmatirosa kalamazoonensis TaxID=861299 RepID=W0RSG2_9BACT|nr:DUF4440 domain-containing protein [Gemmatirosa kalamazoonensis]AHG93407.1 hypothetical protein J421_5872 [Gemmatirosa kalamazoonensis]
MSTHRFALALLAVLVAAGRAHAQPHVQPSPAGALDTAAVIASARADIDAANAAWIPGLRQRDAARIVAAYADSGLFIAADGSVTRGRDAVARMYAATFPRLREIVDGGVVQDGLTVASADRLYEWGHAWLAMAAATPGAPPTRGGGAYLTVWQRGADGHWRIARNLAW